MKAPAAQIGRYVLVGMTNTLVGFVLISGLDVGFHTPPALANAIVYSVGFVMSYLLNRSFVFNSSNAVLSSGPKFATVVGLAFVLNQIVLWIALQILGSGNLQHLLAQGSAMFVYSVSAFLGCRYWAFRGPAPSVLFAKARASTGHSPTEDGYV